MPETPCINGCCVEILALHCIDLDRIKDRSEHYKLEEKLLTALEIDARKDVVKILKTLEVGRDYVLGSARFSYVMGMDTFTQIHPPLGFSVRRALFASEYPTMELGIEVESAFSLRR